MKPLRIAGAITMSALLLQAEDFSLRYFGAGPIAVHTAMTYEGKGERLVATARNESGAPIHAKICIQSPAMKTGCLFEMWNTEVWLPGAELTWNVTSVIKVPVLTHEATILEFEVLKPPAATSSVPAQPPIIASTQYRPELTSVPAASPQPIKRSGLTNEAILKLAKAGLSDDVIVGMVNSQTPVALTDVHTIFVDTLGTGEASGLIRDKIINRLVSSKRFEVVLSPDKADAILAGSVMEAQGVRYDNGSGGTRFSANAAVRLITRDQRILWTFEARNGAFSRSASSSVADRVVKELLKAVAPPKTK